MTGHRVSAVAVGWVSGWVGLLSQPWRSAWARGVSGGMISCEVQETLASLLQKL